MLSLLALLAAAPTAHADEILLWERDRFGESEVLAGHDGWVNGYEDDVWWATSPNGRAISLTDHNIWDTGITEVFGTGGATDNWLIRGEEVAQGRTWIEFLNQDDDTVGVVFSHDGDKTFYLAAHSADSSPPPIGFVTTGTVFLLKVVDGVPTELARASHHLARNAWHDLSAGQHRGVVFLEVNGERVLEVDDPDPLPPGQSGLYSYDNGCDSSWAQCGYFAQMAVFAYDSDGDGVPDDIDNCPDDYNPDQQDSNGNGLGDVCDDSWPPDEDPDDPDDPDDPNDPDDPDDPGSADKAEEDGIRVGAGGCGCATPSPAVPWLLTGLAGLLVARRRR